MLATREVDYRIVYMKEKDFENRVNEVYHAKQTYRRAPYFMDILEELVDLEASLYMLHNEEAFMDFSESARDDLYRQVEGGDFEAIQTVLGRMDRDFLEKFAKDLFLYLFNHHFTFLERDLYNNQDVVMHNPAVQRVW